MHKGTQIEKDRLSLDMIKTNMESAWTTVVGSTFWVSSILFVFFRQLNKTKVEARGAKILKILKEGKCKKYHSGKTVVFGFKEVFHSLSTLFP